MKFASIALALSIFGFAQRYANSEARKHLWPLSKIIIRSTLYQTACFLLLFLIFSIWAEMTGQAEARKAVTQPVWTYYLFVGCYLFVIGHSIHETHTEVECERIERGNS